MLLFPFRLVSFELFYILFRGLELRDFGHIFPAGFFADFIPPGIGIVFEFQQEAKTAKLGMILADKFQVCSPSGIRAFQGPGKIIGKMLTAEIEKSSTVKIFIDPLEYGFRELRDIQLPVPGKERRDIRVIHETGHQLRIFAGNINFINIIKIIHENGFHIQDM